MPQYELSELEIETRRIIGADRDLESLDKLPPQGFAIRQTIRNVFVARWHSAFPADRLHELAQAWDGWKFDDIAFRRELTGFVRRKVLRSYVKEGKRLYEVNYQ